MGHSPQIEPHFDLGLAKPSDNYKAIKSPCYLSGLPSGKDWLGFTNSIENPETISSILVI